MTFTTKYGLEKAQAILEDVTNKGINEISSYEEKGEFLKELALYIKDREK